jgi:hypothetical protein
VVDSTSLPQVVLPEFGDSSLSTHFLRHTQRKSALFHLAAVLYPIAMLSSLPDTDQA